MANAKFDMHMLANSGAPPFEGSCVDVAVMHALLHEEDSHSLKEMCKQILGWRWTDFMDTFKREMVLDTTPKGLAKSRVLKNGQRSVVRRPETIQEMLLRAARDNLDILVDYASNDAYGTLKLYETLDKELLNTKTYSLYPDVYPTLGHLFYLTEVPFTKVLWKCERNGVFINQEYLQTLRAPMQEEVEALERKAVELSGKVDFNINATKDLRDYFESEGYTFRTFTSGGKSGIKVGSVDKGFLEYYENQSDMAALVLRYRKLTKLIGTYIDSVHEFTDVQSRIHTRFNQDVARCMPAGELVLTSRGYLPVEQVKVGDRVITHRGRQRAVVEVSTYDPKPIYVVGLYGGLTLRTTGNHQYWTPNGSWVRADELKPGDEVVVHSTPEEWRPVSEWDGYSVSSWGRVRNESTGSLLTAQPKGKWGHLKVTLTRAGAQKRGANKKDFAVHRLVAEAFCARDVRSTEVRHLDGIGWNNTRENLMWGTSKENTEAEKQ
jgi:hypothetical protein